MTKPRTRRYRRRKPKRRWLTLENISLIKQFFVTVGPIFVAAYLWVIPEVDAKMTAYVRSQFIAVGMNPENLEKLSNGLAELQETVKEKDAATDQLSRDVLELKGLIGSVIEFQKLQIVKGAPPIDEPAK